MDRDRFSALAHATHLFANPVSASKADWALGLIEIGDDALAVEVGAGACEMAIRLACRGGARRVARAAERSVHLRRRRARGRQRERRAWHGLGVGRRRWLPPLGRGFLEEETRRRVPRGARRERGQVRLPRGQRPRCGSGGVRSAPCGGRERGRLGRVRVALRTQCRAVCR
jgi:hypothetical protein